MDQNKIIDALGGSLEVARLFEVTVGAVSQWRTSGIPRARLMFLRLLRPDLFLEEQDAERGVVEPSDLADAAPLVAPPEPIHECASGDPRYHPDRRQSDKRKTERRHPDQRQAPRRKEGA